MTEFQNAVAEALITLKTEMGYAMVLGHVAMLLAPRVAAAIQEVAQFAYDRGLVNAVGSGGVHGFAKDGSWDSVALTALRGTP